jgi:mRNA interferase MazF
VLTRDAAIDVLQRIVCAQVTRTVRGIRSEVEVGTNEGLPGTSVISCDHVVTIPKALLAGAPVGQLGPAERASLDAALRYALDIVY